MITQREFIMIHERKKQDHSIHAIAKITGKGRKTIRKHLQKAELKEIQRTNKKPLKLDAFKYYILGRISKSLFRIPSGVIFKEICSAGYIGRLKILQKLLQVEYAKRVKHYG